MGTLGYSPQSFFIMEPYECLDVMNTSRKRLQYEHELQYTAMLNALGNVFIKNYTYKDVFKSNNERTKKEVTEEEKADMKNFLENW